MDSESLLSPLGNYRVLTVDRLHAALSLLIDRGYGDMPDESLLPFLKSYAAALRDDSMLGEYAPFSCRTEMAMGCVLIDDRMGHPIARIQFWHRPDGTEFDRCPSMPITPMDVGFAKLAVDMVNAALRERKQLHKMESDNGSTIEGADAGGRIRRESDGSELWSDCLTRKEPYGH